MAYLRFLRQYIALQEKNFLVLWRRPLYLLVALFLPAIAVLIFLVGGSNSSGSSSESVVSSNKQVPSVLQGLGTCDVYYTDRCLQVAFSPQNSWTEGIMKGVADYNNIEYGKLFKPFTTSTEHKVSNVMFLKVFGNILVTTSCSSIELCCC